MALPEFNQAEGLSAEILRKRISDHVRRERSRQGLSQLAFAAKCGVSLRTYKRFELGHCDSIDVFIRITIASGRVRAFDLFFEPDVPDLQLKTAPALLSRLLKNRKPTKTEAT
jgi:transcriptional regulator with XRE-family HTH domain